MRITASPRIAVALATLLFAGSAFAADNAVVITAGSGVTMRSKDTTGAGGPQSMMPIPGDVAGNPLATAPGTGNASYALPIQGVAGGIAVPSAMTGWAGSTIGTGTIQAFGATQSTIGSGLVPAVNAYVVNASGDPCTGVKSTADFESTSSGGSIITAVSGKKAYLCSITIVASAAANVGLVEGTGSSVCTGGATAGVFLISGVTPSTAGAFAANGGVQAGSGIGTIAQNGTANQNVCVVFTTTNSPQVNVHLSYVQQ